MSTREIKLRLRIHTFLLYANAIIAIIFSIAGGFLAVFNYNEDIMAREFGVVIFAICVVITILTIINTYRYDYSINLLKRKLNAKGR